MILIIRPATWAEGQMMKVRKKPLKISISESTVWVILCKTASFLEQCSLDRSKWRCKYLVSTVKPVVEGVSLSRSHRTCAPYRHRVDHEILCIYRVKCDVCPTVKAGTKLGHTAANLQQNRWKRKESSCCSGPKSRPQADSQRAVHKLIPQNFNEWTEATL